MSKILSYDISLDPKEKTEHQEGQIQLVDRRIIDCYEPKGESPDTANARLFTDNAFLLLANYEKILSDSRMFLTPIDVVCGVNVGGKPFDKLTLGIFIEWWLMCNEAVVLDNDLNSQLIWQFFGYVMSGSNQCKCVDKDGAISNVGITCFRKAWECLAYINRRYKQAKDLYQAYSLAETIDMIKAAPDHKSAEHAASMLLIRISHQTTINNESNV